MEHRGYWEAPVTAQESPAHTWRFSKLVHDNLRGTTSELWVNYISGEQEFRNVRPIELIQEKKP